jgi:predicted nucleic acid-binding protein
MYLIDTSVLIEAKNRYYAFDIAPGFWAWLDRAHTQGLACSIEAVRGELLAGNDELAQWAKQHPAFFQGIDQGTTQHFAPLTAWAASRTFTTR